jgi:hypothetical protein
MLTLEQARAALQNLSGESIVTYDQVRAIVSQVDARSSTGNGILYSGNMSPDASSPYSGDVANGIAQNSGGRLTTIDMTDRGQLLFDRTSSANSALRDALRQVALTDNPGLSEDGIRAAVRNMITGDR